MPPPVLGVALPASPGAASVGDHLAALLAAGVACEDAGVGLLVVDGRLAPREGRRLEPFAVLGAIASLTSSLRLAGLCRADERAPSLLAKATATLDVCSGGRAALLLAPAAGTLPPAEVPVHLGECVEVAQAMLALEAPTIAGAHVAVERAWNEPRVEGHQPAVGVVTTPGAPLDQLVPARPDWIVVEHRPGLSDEVVAPLPSSERHVAPEVLALVAPGNEDWPPLGLPAGYDGLIWSLGDPLLASPPLLERLGALTRGTGPDRSLPRRGPLEG